MCMPHNAGCQRVGFVAMPSSEGTGCHFPLTCSDNSHGLQGPPAWAESDNVLPGCIFCYNLYAIGNLETYPSRASTLIAKCKSFVR